MTLPLEKQVTSLELSKRLKELGVPQESLFWWSEHTKPATLWSETSADDNAIWDDRQCSAFTVAELGEMLPSPITDVKCDDYWKCCVLFDIDNYVVEGKTEADARAKMLIYLIENGLVEGKGKLHCEGKGV